MASEKENIQLSFGIQGMERQNFQHQLDEKVFTFQRNGNMETDEEGIGLTNEHSNLLCSRFKEGYMVIGHKYDSNKNRIYFFITEKNKSSKLDEEGNEIFVRKSEIGFIKFNTDISNIEDIENECGCDFSSDLSVALENILQVPYCQYETIVGDDCNNCLNFDPNFPVFDIVLKQETCGYTMSFTDNNNAPRYLILDKLDPYFHTGTSMCGNDETEPTCLDCEKLRIFPLYQIPKLTPYAIQFGGRLKRGSYEFLIAYSDKLGNEMSPYFSLTQPISIFDKNNNVLDQSQLADITNLGIRLDVTNLDKRFNYYKIVVIQNADINGIVTPLVEGIHNINDDSIVYTSDIDKQRTTLNHIFAEKPNYKTFGGLIAANNYLIGYDYTIEKEWNLQPVVNLMGSLFRWQTVEAKEDLYADGIRDSLYTGYMRDEVYPFGIRFGTNEGYRTAVFPLIGRPGNELELENISNYNNNDIKSINENTPECANSDRKYRWQYYNTASILGYCNETDTENGTPVTRELTEECYIKNVDSIPSGSITLKLDDNFSTLKNWIEDHREEVCDITSDYYNELLCSYLSDTYPEDICPSDWSENNIFPFPICNTSNCPTGTCNEPELLSSEIDIDKVIGENITNIEKCLEGETCEDENAIYYKHSAPNGACNEYYPGTDANNRKKLEVFEGRNDEEEYDLYSKYQRVYQRNDDFYTNSSCETYTSIPYSNDFFVPQLYSITDPLYSNITSVAYTGFTDKLNNRAKWYYYIFEEGSDEIIIEITPTTSNCKSDEVVSDEDIRYTIYDSCNYEIIKSGVYNPFEGLFLRLKKSEVNANDFYIALDTKILNKSFKATNVRYYDNGDVNELPSINVQLYYISVPCGCFDIKIRDKEYYKVIIDFEEITLDKTMTYKSICNFMIPKLDNCDPVAHKYGKFSYWESEEIYPDNSQLYDSSELIIRDEDLILLNNATKNEFKNYYVDSISDNKFVWKNEQGKSLVDFTCRPIRHYKFPDNRVIPFMDDLPTSGFSDNRIYPIGVNIDLNVINTFLDIAVKNNIITKEQRDSITDYEIFRGDRSIHKSIIMKGIVNDMYKDEQQSTNNQLTLFRNFPYNTLGNNAFLNSDTSRNELLKHPFDSEKNNRFSLIAPEIYYNRPEAPTEVSIEGYMYGNSIGGFKPFKNHSEWVILGEKAYKLADKLATLEVTFESVMSINTALIEVSHNTEFFAGIAGVGQNIAGTVSGYIAAGLITAANIASAILFKQVRYKTEWLQIFENMGNSHNFAEIFVSQKGWYNSFIPNKENENLIRGIVTAKYLKPGVPMFTEGANNNGIPIRVNNRDRETSLYISFGDNYFLEYPQRYKNYDNYSVAPRNSSRYISSEANCNNETNVYRRIASPYFSMKNYVPNQYGTIDSINWLSINHDGKLNGDNDCKSIFGGDIKISRVDFKNKISLFNNTAMDIANNTPFDYSRYPNIATPRFYCSYKSVDRTTGTLDVPYLSTEFNFDCRRGQSVFYEKNPSKMYTHLYAIPYFLVESEINGNYRYAGKEPHEQFASNGLNVEEWVQEKNTSIAFNNIFYYNQIYSRQQTGLPYRKLTGVYDKTTWDCLAESPNGVVYSQQDNSEVSLNDPWLVFKPFDIYQFRTDYGKLISMSNIESQQVLVRFENNMSIFNAVDTLKDRTTPENQELGLGGMFAQRPIQFSFTELGETGSQHRSIVYSEFGHFWVDAKRGKVFQLSPNGQSLSIISDFKGKGDESGMRKWFKRHLPFKILKSKILNLEERNVDNPYKGLGILIWWDSRFKRVFITKKDYKVKKQYENKIQYSGGNFYVISTLQEIQLTDSEYFEDVSWTLAYSPMYQNWISYYDFKPDYAVSYNDYFQTGLNYSKDNSEIGLWSHLLTNKSFQVFYGKKYPWEIEVPVKNNYLNNILQDLQIWMTSKRYHNEYDYAIWRKKGFNKTIIYNQTNNSGLLNLDYVDSYKKSDYPKYISNTEQKIPATHFDDQIRFNYFYNRVKKEESHLPIWLSDENEINKTLNEKTISFKGKNPLERIRGDWFMIRLISDHSSQFKSYFKWMFSNEKPYRS